MKILKSNGKIFLFLLAILFFLTCFCMQQSSSTGSVRQITLNIQPIDSLHHKSLVESYLQKFVSTKKIPHQVLKYVWNFPDRRKAKQVKRYIELVINTCASIRKSKNITGNQLAGEFEEAVSFMPANPGQYDYIVTGDPEYLRAGNLCAVMTDRWREKLNEITHEIDKEWVLANQATLADNMLVLQAKTHSKPFESPNIQSY